MDFLFIEKLFNSTLFCSAVFQLPLGAHIGRCIECVFYCISIKLLLFIARCTLIPT